MTGVDPGDLERLAGVIVTRIEHLALEEQDAVRRRDWSAARTSAEERATLQKAHHRILSPTRRSRSTRGEAA